MRISVVIRTLNEAVHLGDLLSMISQQQTAGWDIETIVVDSGSTDGTLQIAQSYNARIVEITRSEFTFGRSLNRGCASAESDIIVMVSGHCVPVRKDWLSRLCAPLIAGDASYSYGRQLGDDSNNYSERRIFAKYFPEGSKIPQDGFFCNNANSAILTSVWKSNPFDEELTGLEDIELAKRLFADGHKIAYVAEAPVFHHHSESWRQVRRRFEREALALSVIMPEIQLSWIDVARCILSSTFADWRSASRNGVVSTTRADMLRYRVNQYLGSYHGNRAHRTLSREAKGRFFYPDIPRKADQDEWLKPLRRPTPHEGQQPTYQG